MNIQEEHGLLYRVTKGVVLEGNPNNDNIKDFSHFIPRIAEGDILIRAFTPDGKEVWGIMKNYLVDGEYKTFGAEIDGEDVKKLDITLEPII